MQAPYYYKYGWSERGVRPDTRQRLESVVVLALVMRFCEIQASSG